MADLAPETEELTTAEDENPRESPISPRRLLRGFGLGLVIIAVLLAVYGTVAYAAWQRGQTMRVQNAQEALEDQIANQIELARGDIGNGNFALALRRLDWVLERNPASSEALALQAEAQGGLDARLTPTALPSPTATPEADETPEAGSNQAETQEAFTNFQALMEDGNWAAAITAVSAFQHDYPNERRGETDEMLYNAYTNLGIKMLSDSQIELGLFYLSQAERLGDLPLEIQDQRTWAELYLLGIGYYDVNWETAIFYFRGLCAAAPFYQDACQKLFDAYVAYGDQYASVLDWCPAEEWYIEAIRLDNDVTEVFEKRREATTNCQEATPTPEAPVTNTVPITSTLPTVSFSDTLPTVSFTETLAP